MVQDSVPCTSAPPPPPALVKATMMLLMTMLMITWCLYYSTPVQGVGVNQPKQHPPSERYEQSLTDVTASTFGFHFNQTIPAATRRTWNQSSEFLISTADESIVAQWLIFGVISGVARVQEKGTQRRLRIKSLRRDRSRMLFDHAATYPHTPKISNGFAQVPARIA